MPAAPCYPTPLQPAQPARVPQPDAQEINPKGKNKKAGKKRGEMTVGEQLLDSFAKSATASAGREMGRSLTRSLLGVLGLNGGKRR